MFLICICECKLTTEVQYALAVTACPLEEEVVVRFALLSIVGGVDNHDFDELPFGLGGWPYAFWTTQATWSVDGTFADYP